MTEEQEFANYHLSVAHIEYMKEAAQHPMDFDALWLERLHLVGMNVEERSDQRVLTEKGKRFLEWLEKKG